MRYMYHINDCLLKKDPHIKHNLYTNTFFIFCCFFLPERGRWSFARCTETYTQRRCQEVSSASPCSTDDCAQRRCKEVSSATPCSKDDCAQRRCQEVSSATPCSKDDCAQRRCQEVSSSTPCSKDDCAQRRCQEISSAAPCSTDDSFISSWCHCKMNTAYSFD